MYDVDVLGASIEKTNMSMLNQGTYRTKQKIGKLSIKSVYI